MLLVLLWIVCCGLLFTLDWLLAAFYYDWCSVVNWLRVLGWFVVWLFVLFVFTCLLVCLTRLACEFDVTLRAVGLFWLFADLWAVFCHCGFLLCGINDIVLLLMFAWVLGILYMLDYFGWCCVFRLLLCVWGFCCYFDCLLVCLCCLPIAYCFGVYMFVLSVVMFGCS